MSDVPRRGGRPATGQKPARFARIDDEQWDPYEAFVGKKNVPKHLGDLVAWWARVPGAKMPSRPPDYDDRSTSELKDILIVRGLSTEGTKPELIERLRVSDYHAPGS